MITPLSETGNVRGLKHSSHILIFCFIVNLVKCGCKITKRLPTDGAKNRFFD